MPIILIPSLYLYYGNLTFGLNPRTLRFFLWRAASQAVVRLH